MKIGMLQTVAGLLNAMIGGTMLAIPVVALNAGYLICTVTVLGLCMIEGFTVYLIVSHLGDARSIKQLILNHFKMDKFYLNIYNVVVLTSYFLAMAVYFPLFCIQIQGLFGKWSLQEESLAVFIILWMLALRKCQMNDFALAVGLSSVFAFMLFLGWAYTVRPEGPNTVPAIGPQPSTFILATLNGLTSHDYLLQLIVHHDNKKNYPKIIALLYTIGGCIFLYISFGSFAIVNIDSERETVIGYYEEYNGDSWQLTALQIIVLIHILTAFPEYSVFSKARVFSLLGWANDEDEEGESELSFQEIVYNIILVGMCYLVYKMEVNIDDLLAITGGIIGVYLSYCWPTWLHSKCLLYDQSSGFISEPNQRNLAIQSNPSHCQHTYSSPLLIYLQVAFLLTATICAAFYFVSLIPQSMNAT